MDPVDKVRDEFYSEAQEIIDTLSRNLLALDAAQKTGLGDPSLVNEAFRAVHTLKGLAGLFGSARIGTLAHRAEDLLDDLRLGRMDLRPELLDLLFRAVDVFGQILSAEKLSSDEPIAALTELLTGLESVARHDSGAGSPLEHYDLDPGVLAVLTEYEEHRLRTNVQNGLTLYRLRVQFELATIDRALDDMKERAKRHGEIITYLPTGESASIDTIELDLLMASRDDLAALAGALGADNVVIEAIQRRHGPPAGARPQRARRRARAPGVGAPARHRRTRTRGRRCVTQGRQPDGPRRHPQARSPDEHRGRARHRTGRALAHR
jgi:two-component system, chemotaxis family, sensor kinase CheA